MSRGRLQANGTPDFLKQQTGTRSKDVQLRVGATHLCREVNFRKKETVKFYI